MELALTRTYPLHQRIAAQVFRTIWPAYFWGVIVGNPRGFVGWWPDKADGIFRAVVLHLTNAVAKAMADAFTTALDAGTQGYIGIYDSTIPTDADTAVGAQVLLAELLFTASPSFGAATDANPGGLITANAITSDSSANATGTAAWARVKTQSGGTTIADVNVGTASTFVVLNTTSITSGSAVAITAWTMTMSQG